MRMANVGTRRNGEERVHDGHDPAERFKPATSEREILDGVEGPKHLLQPLRDWVRSWVPPTRARKRRLPTSPNRGPIIARREKRQLKTRARDSGK